MKDIPYYEIHAFTSKELAGNPAGVCLLNDWPSKEAMQSIAYSNNLSETAFLVKEQTGYKIRFFTPNNEVDLCGHATLASAWVLFHILGCEDKNIPFTCRGGQLTVTRDAQGLQMSLPALPYASFILSDIMQAGFSVLPQETYRSTYDLLCVYESVDQIESIQFNLEAFKQFPYRGLILTAPAARTDIYSRCFFPNCDVFEDPVTGSAHAVLTPFWCNKFQRNTLHAEQGFRRRGELFCQLDQDRVLITGQCKIYLKGHIVFSC